MTRPLAAADLLEVWERALPLPPAARALALLGAAEPATPPAALGALSAGERDRRLLELHERTFGASLEAVVACPACGARLELGFSAAHVRGAPAAPAEQLDCEAEGHRVRFRVPTAADLAALAAAEPAPGRALLERCVLGAWRGGEAVAPAELPAAVAVAVGERMLAADPQAEVRLALDCAGCEHRWQATFDVLPFLWAEVDAWARRLAAEVHLLAGAYGWREAEILALSPWRRQLYLRMVAQ